MNFLPDVYVQCDVCKGARYNAKNSGGLQGPHIAEVLQIDGGSRLGRMCSVANPPGADRCATLVDVGLGYIKLGQTGPPSPAARLTGQVGHGLSKRAHARQAYLITSPPPASALRRPQADGRDCSAWWTRAIRIV